MDIVQFISNHPIECTMAVLILCLLWAHYWTHKTKRDFDTLHDEVLTSHANIRSEIRDIRRRLSNEDSSVPSFSSKSRQ